MKTETLRKIYYWGWIALGILTFFATMTFIMGSISVWMEIPAWVVYPTLGTIVVSAVIMAHGINQLSEMRRKYLASIPMPRADVVESQTDWMAKEKFGWDCAKSVADKHLTPEEWEIFYDKLAAKEWEGWVRFDAPALPKTRFGKESLEIMLGEAI
jgi:hypothetical protein